MDIHNERAEEIIRHLASEFISQESNRNSMITVTNISISKDFKNASIFVTVFPENQEKAVIDFLKRQRSEFKNYIRKNSRLNRIPLIDFSIDFGEKSRLKIDEISKNI